MNEHDPGCDTRELSPTLGASTKPCNCGAGEPLNIRCARGLGCLVKSYTDDEGYRWWECACPEEDEGHYDSTGTYLRPYGEDTPEGWACTGPLIERFRFDVLRVEDGWVVERWEGRIAHAATPCAAIAEWVAQHGAAAIAAQP